MADLRVVKRTMPDAATSDQQTYSKLEASRLGSLFLKGEYERLVDAGFGYIGNAGRASSPITFGAAYDATAPDWYLRIPFGKTVIPLDIYAIFEAVGTESSMEVIAVASNTGDATVTGTTTNPLFNLRTDKGQDSGCTFTYAVDASGVTSPYAGNFFEFWQEQRPLTDTVATGENDRHQLKWNWNYMTHGPAPRIVGNQAGDGSALAIYCPSQAGTGFVTCRFLAIPSEWL